MTPIERIDSLFALLLDVSLDISIFWIIISLIFLLVFVMYGLFSLLVVKQVFMMTSTFRTTAGPVLKILAFLHFIFAIVTIFFAFAVLF